MMPIRLERVSKRLGATAAVDDVSLEVAAGELFFLLGPSGCGKTTLLNLIAGLLEPTSGKIWFGSRDVTKLQTNQRSAVMCFQSYALWPHLSVEENVRFGLDVRRWPAARRAERVREALELVRMLEYRERKPAELSGGQQQRVAIARAIAVEPECLLLDEPLSNLDTRLRQEMRSEIRRICRATGLTTLYVTHDQKEALSIADRIAIMQAGRIAQIGAPVDLYTRPATPFVAEFLGHANLIPGRITERRDLTRDAGAPPGSSDVLRVDTPIGELTAFAGSGLAASVTEVMLSIRPEQVRVADSVRAVDRLPNRDVRAELLDTAFLGDASEHHLRAGELDLRMVCVPPRLDLQPEVALELAAHELIVLPR